MDNNFFYIDQTENSNKVWTNNYRGYLVKSTFDSRNGRIIQCGIPYNFPQTSINFFNNSKKEFNAGLKKVNKDLFCYTKI